MLARYIKINFHISPSLIIVNFLETYNYYSNRLGKFILTLAQKAFLVILILILLNLTFGLFLLYKYVIFSNIEKMGNSESSLEFREEFYQSFLKEKQNSSDFKENYIPKEYLDPFLKK